MKPASYYKGKEQTYIKHFFLERYLETLAFHIAYYQQEFIYVDCFSGPWRSEDEEFADTSIRIALDKLNRVYETLAATGRTRKIRAIFIEKAPSSFASLKRALQQHSRNIATTAFEGAFEDNIPNILHEVRKAFAFFFIDPKGWTGLPMDSIRPILQHRPGEVMVNFMYDFINRFLNYPDPSNETSLDQFFGTPNWRAIRDAPDREIQAVDLYTQQLRQTGSYDYATWTCVLKTRHDRPYFHLGYATRSPKGILEFREVEKKTFPEQESVREMTQRADRETRTGQGEFPFATDQLSPSRQRERDEQRNKALRRLDEILAQGPTPYGIIQPLILQIPLVWASDLNDMLIQQHKKGLVSIRGMGPRERTLKPHHVIASTKTSS